MHPIERLRYVARSSGAAHQELVVETAAGLASLGFDPPGLVTACRRVLERHPLSGPLWWLASRVLTADDPGAEAWVVAEDLADDPTAARLAGALPDDATVCVLGWSELIAAALPRRGDAVVLAVEDAGLGPRLRRADVEAVDVPMSGLGAAASASDLVLLEASALGPTGFMGAAGSRAMAAVAHHAGVPVWVVAGLGRPLPAPVWQAVVARSESCADRWSAADELVPIDLADLVVGPRGLESADAAVRSAACPVAPELLRSLR
ncbi:MAG: hypothetical protein ACRD0U_11760 [Acidimicrobiales bacterium]